MERASGWFCDWLTKTALCGALNYWSREEPAAAPGLSRLADRERGLAASIIEENLGDQDRMTLILVAFIALPAGQGGLSRADDANRVGAAGP